MRTTLDIDEDLLRTVKKLAATRRSTAGKILSELARTALEPSRRSANRRRNGVPLLPPRQGEGPVTMAMVSSLRGEAP
jgi:hypothetical protein